MRWGIVGSGNISTQFVEDSRFAPGAEIVGVCSRVREKATAFAQKMGILRVFDSLESMLDCEELENIYIGTPHPLHRLQAIACLEAGKNVLCEKPLAINASEARDILQAAKRSGTLLADGMWTRCFPAMAKLREWIADGTLGEVQLVTADMGYNAILAGEDKTWRHQGAYGGGALLDVGIYCIYLALDIFGAESLKSVQGCARIHAGIDQSNAFALDFGGRLFTAATSLINESPCAVHLLCEKGNVAIGNPWWASSALEFTPYGGEAQRLEFPYDAKGMQYEIMAFERAAKAGEKQNPLVPHADTLAAMEIMDALRLEWGLRYPQDE